MEGNSRLIGNDEVPSIKPIIITYNDPLTVLPKYVEILNSTFIPEMNNLSVLEIANNERQEDPLHRLNVKACGWVGKKGANERKRFIESYFPTFEKKNVKNAKKSSIYTLISHKYLILVRSTGIALLAARPAPPLSMASFAVELIVVWGLCGKAFFSRKTAPTLNSCRVFGSY